MTSSESAATFCFYNHNERMEVLNALTCYRKKLKEEQEMPVNVRATVLDQIIDDFQTFALAN